MQRYLFFSIVFLSAVALSGCSTAEVRKGATVKDDLSFYSDTAKQEAATVPTPPQNKTLQTPKAPSTPPNTVTNKKMYTQAPQMTLDTAKKYSATIKTDIGDIIVDLDAKDVPKTVNNFVFLAREKFYDNTIFHRAIKGFMIQGGDPEGTGRGGPGYQFADEPFSGEYTRGTLAMANAGPNTNGSQFFIMHKDTPLPKSYVIFGQVTAGMDIVDTIAEAPTIRGGEGSSPVTPIVVKMVTVTEK